MSNICVAASAALLLAACSPFQEPTERERAVILAVENSPLKDLEWEGESFFKSDTLLFNQLDGKSGNSRSRISFSASCRTAGSEMALTVHRVRGHDPRPTDRQAIEQFSGILKALCGLNLNSQVQRVFSDISVDSALIFVFEDENQRLEFFKSRRPSRFLYDVGVSRKRLNSQWDRLELTSP